MITGHSTKTITAFITIFQDMIVSEITINSEKIGGEGIIIEVDESKFGKRKYNKGHKVDGVWVIGGVERTPERRFFAEPVKDRSAVILIDFLKRNILPGSIIYSDMWKGYTKIPDLLKLEHKTVNHSKNFKDPITDACTNMVEGVNSGIKRAIPVRNRVESGIEYHLGEYLWRRQNSDNLFNHFIDAIRDIHYFN